MIHKILKLIKYSKNQLITVDLGIDTVQYCKNLLLSSLSSFVSIFILSVLTILAVLLISIK